MDQDNKDINSGGVTPVMDVQPPRPAPEPEPAPAPATPAANQTPAASPLAIDSKQAPKKSGRPIGIIILAILVALGLAGAAAYMYLQSKDKPAANEHTEHQTTEEDASAETVDEATKEIDDSLNSLDDDQDFNGSSLSDTDLGL